MGTEIFVHLFLDALNAYGVGWFEPFSHYRVSFNVIFVADPFFSVWPGVAVIFLLILNHNVRKRRRWAVFGLVVSFLYLIYCLSNKFSIENAARIELARQGINYNRYFTTPTPFNNWLWFIVAETDSGFQIGYHSVFDKNSQIEFRYFPRNANLLNPFYSQEDLQKLIRFSQGYYTADSSSHGIEFNDLRFGQMMGWQNSEAHFVFHFYLQQPAANLMVVQRGRFANWNRATIRAFIRRIRRKLNNSTLPHFHTSTLASIIPLFKIKSKQVKKKPDKPITNPFPYFVQNTIAQLKIFFRYQHTVILNNLFQNVV